MRGGVVAVVSVRGVRVRDLRVVRERVRFLPVCGVEELWRAGVPDGWQL